jgi:hypothetical protein
MNTAVIYVGFYSIQFNRGANFYCMIQSWWVLKLFYTYLADTFTKKKHITMYYLRKGTPNYMVCYILLLICQDMRLIAFAGDAILTCVSVFFWEDCHIKYIVIWFFFVNVSARYV